MNRSAIGLSRSALVVAMAPILLLASIVAVSPGGADSLSVEVLHSSRGKNQNNILTQFSCNTANNIPCAAPNVACLTCGHVSFTMTTPGKYGGYDTNNNWVPGGCGPNFIGTCNAALTCVPLNPNAWQGMCSSSGPPRIQPEPWW